MSGKTTAGRSKRPESQNSYPKQDGKCKQDFRIHENSSNGKSSAHRSSPSTHAVSFRERDKNHNSRDARARNFSKVENTNFKKRDLENSGVAKSGKNDVPTDPKFHESVITQHDNVIYGREFGNSESKKNFDHSKAFGDDSRLSKIVRRLIREDDRDKRLTAGKHLREFFLQPENVKTVLLKVDSLLTVLQDIFNERTYKDVKQDAALCVGTLGSVLGADPQRYVQWILTKIRAAVTEESKILFLSALYETLHLQFEENKQLFADYMPSIMTNVQSVLENADSPDLLKTVVTVIMHITKHYPHVFSSHFKDTVDILVGWHIDSTQKDSLTEFTSQALISFQQFWMTDISFSVTLLGQFLEDMEAYAEDLGLAVSGQNAVDDDMPTPEECVTKIAALLKVFTTVVKGLGDYLVSRGQSSGQDYLSDIAAKDINTVERIVRCVESSAKSFFCEKVMTSANVCLTCLVTNLQSHTVQCCNVLLPFLMSQLNSSQIFSNRQIISILNLLHKVCEQVNTKLPVDFISQLLEADSLILLLRFHQDSQVLKELMAVYHVILSLKSVPLLEEAYRFILGDLELEFNSLLKVCNSDTEVHLVTNNPFTTSDTCRRSSSKKSVSVIVFGVCALAEISNTKNNLIGMWALSPSIFDLLSKHLLPCHKSLAEKFPATQYAVLHALYSHCNRHGHHIGSSSLITQNSPVDGSNSSSLLASVSPATSQQFSTVLHVLATVLTCTSTSYDAMLLAIQWSHEIIEALQKNVHVYRSSEFSSLMQAVSSSGFSSEVTVSLAACGCLSAALQISYSFTQTVLKNCVILCAVKLSDNDVGVREAYTELLKWIPVDVTIGCAVDVEMKSSVMQIGMTGNSSRFLWLPRRNHMVKMSSGTFHSHNFRSVMGYIMHNIQPTAKFSQILDRIFHTCQRTDRDIDRTNPHGMIRMVDGSKSLQWFWATWEAAQYCILSKLRTPLGKPQETFTTIEASLRAYASQLTSRDMDEIPSASQEKDLVEDSCFTEHLRVNLLLLFMENLEKLLYNAYEGCTVAMPAPIKAVKTFFRTNKNTCVEWLNRIRLNVLVIALQAGLAAVAVRQAFQLLTEMTDAGNTQSTDFDLVVTYLVKGLCELRCPDALHGVYAWCKKVTGKRVTWIKAAVDFATGRYETSAADFKSCLKQHLGTEGLVDDLTRMTSSPAHSPLGSPKHTSVTDSLQKFSILSKNSAEPDPHLVSFISNQVVECYTRLNDLDEVLAWQDTLQQFRLEHAGSTLQKAFTTTADLNYIRALRKFDELDFESARGHLELVPGASVSGEVEKSGGLALGWDCSHIQHLSHQNLVTALTLYHTSDNVQVIEKVQNYLQKSEDLCQGLLDINAHDWPPRLHPMNLMSVHTLTAVRNQLQKTGMKNWEIPLSDDVKFDGRDYEVGVFNEALRTIHLQHHTAAVQGLDISTDMHCVESRLRVAMVGLCRKQHNFALAEKLLIKEMTTVAMTIQPENGKLCNSHSVLSALSAVHAANSSVDQLKLLRVERETAKLLHDKGKNREAIDTISSSTSHHCKLLLDDVIKDKSVQFACCDLNSRSLLSLVQWLQGDHKFLNTIMGQLKVIGQGDEANINNVAHSLKLLIELEGSQANQGKLADQEDLKVIENPVLGESDILIGRLLHLATIQSPSLAKAWFMFAGWCYKWGRKAVDNASQGTVELSTDEKAEILSLLPKGTNLEETEAVLGILSQIHAGVASDEDISDQDQLLYDDSAETTRRQLLSACMPLQIASDQCVESLLNVWRRLVVKIYHHYQLSAKAYFNYLKLNNQGEEVSINMDGNITATLRLLRLLVKHAWELRGVLEDGLAHTPTMPWKGIIPQLFSRLNHPEAYVRQSVSDLLCRVALDAPHLIVYPAVVGCSRIVTRDPERDGLLSDYLMGGDEDKLGLEQDVEQSASPPELEDSPVPDDSSNTMLQNCFSAIADTLSHHNPRMISEVQQLVEELRRVAVLWDELWLGTLNQHHQDVSHRLQQLENEVKKVMANSSLNKEEKSAIIHEKHITVLKPTLFSLERLKEITTQTAVTRHETWFQQTYGKTIEEAVNRLKYPSNPSNPYSSWQLFKTLYHNLQQRAQKRTSLILKMDEISSRLSSMQGTVIAMPGLAMSGQVITIESIHNTVQILPTKTKPKKLIFIGSDGRKYPYLFKGLEDLHLDERIMQFLAIVNNMLAKGNREDRRLYRARHYSVTPLGSRSGLIQWVDGATPLFSLYKRWQQREAIATTPKTQTNQTSNPPTIMRPGEIFYSKLTPLLKDKGISLESRKEWPLAILRRVLEDLIEDTPKDLLAKELWCTSTCASEWWQIIQTYARSTAVMSMIGYIIGLGDRHLDNVLVDLATGEVVHIDYNVCFEKGKSLRVPEKVPFRMTQNLETALGLTGVEGTFRISCEHVIKTMRKGRETLLTLLEAFVYDPLVDWTTSNEGGYTGAFNGGGPITTGDAHFNKKDMERQITLSMFSIRIVEMRVAWFDNQAEMAAALPQLVDSLSSALKAQEQYEAAEKNHHQITQQQAYLSDAMLDNNHPLYSLKERYSEYSVVHSTREAAQQAVQEKLDECDHWHNLHQYALHTVQSQQLQKLCAEVTAPLSVGVPSYQPVIEFLQSAGQGQMVVQCEQIESDLVAMLYQRHTNMHTCVDMLHTYATVVSQLSVNFVNDNRCTRWKHWLQGLLSDFTLNKCKDVVSQCQDLYSMVNVPDPCLQSVLNTETKLKNIVNDTNTKRLKLIERRSLEGMETELLNQHVKETTAAVHCYTKENGLSGAVSLASVVVTALCSLNKRYLVMEGAAAAAGDRLMDLTSREGDWFLDELCSMSGNVNHLLGLLRDTPLIQSLNPEISQEIFSSMQTTHNVYMALLELNINFRSIIVPETLKTVQAGEASVASTLANFSAILSETETSLDSLLAQLEVILRNTIMGMEVDLEALSIVKKLKMRFESLLEGYDPETTELTAGQMLLMGFNGLFTKLDGDFLDMLHSVSQISVPDIWKKVDVVKESQSLQLSAFNESTLCILSSLFFIKRLQAMQNFFTCVQQFATTLGGKENGPCYDEEQLAKPIKLFIAEYVRKQVIGIPSQTLGYILCLFVNALHVDVTAEIELRDIGAECKVSLEDLCKKAVDGNLRAGTFQPVHLTQASSLVSATDAVWRKQDLAKRLDNNIVLLKATLQRAQLQLARYEWLHEDLFVCTGHMMNQMIVPARSTVMSELRKNVQSLMSQESSLTAIQERYGLLEASITQRLKWAAGANPSLNPVLTSYEEALAARNTLIMMENKLTAEITSICNGILHFEALRTRTPEALSADANFLALLNRCEESCMLSETCSSTVLEEETALMKAKPLLVGESVTADWITAASEQLTQQMNSVSKILTELLTNIETAQETVKSQVVCLRSVLTTHHKLMSDLRSILKTLCKLEEQDHGEDLVKGGIREYVSAYRGFSENFSGLLKLLMSESVSADQVIAAQSLITLLIEQLPSVYGDLVKFAPPLKIKVFGSVQEAPPLNFATALKKTVEPNNPVMRKSVLMNKSEMMSPLHGSSPHIPAALKMPVNKKTDKVARDPRTGKALQERNSYAVGVWRRVKMKLDGRDPDINKRLSVSEQVDFVIEEATNQDNLAMLYEGWTPWV